MRHARYLNIIYLCLLCIFLCAETVLAADEILGGLSVNKDLRVTVRDNGSIGVEQYLGSAYEDRVNGNTDKGSYLVVNGVACGLGYWGTTAGVTLVSNIPIGSTVVTIIECSSGVTFRQETTYTPGTQFINYRWTITNNNPGSVSDLRFYHGGQYQFSASGSQFGDLDSPLNTGSVSIVDRASSQFQSATLRPRTPAQAREVGTFSSVTAAVVTSNQLTDTVNSTDGTYAMEWRNPLLETASFWEIEADERFGQQNDTTQLSVVSPIIETALGGTDQFFRFVVKNDSASNISLTALNASLSFPSSPPLGWSATIASPITLPVVLAGSGGRSVVVVRVTVPNTVSTGDFAIVRLEATESTSSFVVADDALVFAIAPPPTPTPTFTPTSTPTSTPTATPTVPPVVPLTLGAPKRASRDVRPVFSGTAAPNSVVVVSVDGKIVAQGTALKDGAFELSSSDSLSIGRHEVSVAATDEFGRTITLDAPRSFVVTGGAVLDFDGDGLTDLSTYGTLGSTVAFRYRRSSDDTSVVISLAGRVPAPGDYDGDGITDFATIDRNGDGLLWRILGSKTGATLIANLGEVGDRPITGARLAASTASPVPESIAIVTKDRRIQIFDLLKGAVTDLGKFPNSSFTGATQINADPADELLFANKGESNTVITGITVSGETAGQESVPNFDRGFVIRPTLAAENSVFAIVRLISAGQRRATFIGPNTDFSRSNINLPRKVIVSSGTFLESDGTFTTNIVWQDLRKGMLLRQPIFGEAPTVSLGRVALKASLLQPQYVYRTAR